MFCNPNNLNMLKLNDPSAVSVNPYQRRSIRAQNRALRRKYIEVRLTALRQCIVNPISCWSVEINSF